MLACLIALPCSLAANHAALSAQPTPEATPAPLQEDDSPQASEDAAAEVSFSYTYVELLYNVTDYDDVNSDAKGFAIEGSYDINPNFNVIGFYQSDSLDVLGQDFDTNGWGLGIGTHRPINEKVDFYSTLQFLYRDADFVGASDSKTGYGFSFGLRAMALKRLELDAEILYSYVYQSDTSLGLTGRLYVTNSLSASVGAAIGDDLNRFTAGLRYNI